jgi:hypothetical protein
MVILEQMKESHDNLEPLRIGGSAYSVRNREDMKQISENKPVSLGSTPRDNIQKDQKFIGQTRTRSTSAPTKTPKGRKAVERILNMKNKARKP